eukprot:COSAG01_NODE_4699_length_4804_cov_17.017216_2_plen_86_part_00
MMLMSALHHLPQYPHGRLHTAGALSYGRGAVVAEPGSSRRRAGVTAGGALWLQEGRCGRGTRAKDRSAVLRDFPTWLPAACLRQF